MGPMENFRPTEMDAESYNPGTTFKSTQPRILSVSTRFR